LQAKGTLTVAAKVAGFDTTHPDFKLAADPGTIKFGHQIHLKPSLRGLGELKQLQCASCHAQSQQGPMAVANFKDHCESCHPLEFHRKIDRRLPHDKPEVALAFARQALTEYIAQHPGDVNLVEPALDPRIMVARPGPAGNAAEWVRRALEDTQTLMWRKTCIECHTPTPAREIPKAQITTQWLKHATFSHAPHQLVTCTECHATAPISKATADVLLPGIATCQQCHRSTNPSASANCTECHVYHDWSRAKPIDTHRTIDELLNH
jgi:hypothetical protein